MKYCIFCGKELNDDAIYCTSCGKKQELPKKEVAQANKDDGLGFGIATLCLFWVPILPIVFGIIALIKGTKTNRLATIVCASVGLFLAIVSLVLYIIILASLPAFSPHGCYPNPSGGWVCYN